MTVGLPPRANRDDAPEPPPGAAGFYDVFSATISEAIESGAALVDANHLLVGALVVAERRGTVPPKFKQLDSARVRAIVGIRHRPAPQPQPPHMHKPPGTLQVWRYRMSRILGASLNHQASQLRWDERAAHLLSESAKYARPEEYLVDALAPDVLRSSWKE